MQIRAQVVRWVDDDGGQPGWIEVQFPDVDDATVTLVDKVPVFDADVDSESAYPVPIGVDCAVLDERPEYAMVELLHGVVDANGQSRFKVHPAALMRP